MKTPLALPAHSPLGASSMARWSKCPGSVRLSVGLPNTSSAYAEEGTKAHDFAAKWLTWNHGPMLGFPDPEMEAAVTEYVTYVKSRLIPGDVLLVERRFDLSKVHPGCFGTADAVIWKPTSKELIVVDFKYGAGILVDVVDNLQLNYYALGALLTCGFTPDTVETVIVQPRCDSALGTIRTQRVEANALLTFAEDLKKFAAATELPDAPLVPGEHCRFCPAVVACPALKEKRQEVAKLEFSTGVSYSPQQLKLALDSREPIRAWLKALDAFAYTEAEAGRMPPGYKLVAKRPTRKWRDEAEVILAFQDMGKEIYEPQILKSPTQMEKVIGKASLAAYIESVSSGSTLAPVDDKRANAKPSAKEAFTI